VKTSLVTTTDTVEGRTHAIPIVERQVWRVVLAVPAAAILIVTALSVIPLSAGIFGALLIGTGAFLRSLKPKPVLTVKLRPASLLVEGSDRVVIPYTDVLGVFVTGRGRRRAIHIQRRGDHDLVLTGIKDQTTAINGVMMDVEAHCKRLAAAQAPSPEQWRLRGEVEDVADGQAPSGAERGARAEK